MNIGLTSFGKGGIVGSLVDEFIGSLELSWVLCFSLNPTYDSKVMVYGGYGTRSVPTTMVTAYGACLLPCYGTRSVPTTLVKISGYDAGNIERKKDI